MAVVLSEADKEKDDYLVRLLTEEDPNIITLRNRYLAEYNSKIVKGKIIDKITLEQLLTAIANYDKTKNWLKPNAVPFFQDIYKPFSSQLSDVSQIITDIKKNADQFKEAANYDKSKQPAPGGLFGSTNPLVTGSIAMNLASKSSSPSKKTPGTAPPTRKSGAPLGAPLGASPAPPGPTGQPRALTDPELDAPKELLDKYFVKISKLEDFYNFHDLMDESNETQDQITTAYENYKTSPIPIDDLVLLSHLVEEYINTFKNIEEMREQVININNKAGLIKFIIDLTKSNTPKEASVLKIFIEINNKKEHIEGRIKPYEEFIQTLLNKMHDENTTSDPNIPDFLIKFNQQLFDSFKSFNNQNIEYSRDHLKLSTEIVPIKTSLNGKNVDFFIEQFDKLTSIATSLTAEVTTQKAIVDVIDPKTNTHKENTDNIFKTFYKLITIQNNAEVFTNCFSYLFKYVNSLDAFSTAPIVISNSDLIDNSIDQPSLMLHNLNEVELEDKDELKSEIENPLLKDIITINEKITDSYDLKIDNLFQDLKSLGSILELDSTLGLFNDIIKRKSLIKMDDSTDSDFNAKLNNLQIQLIAILKKLIDKAILKYNAPLIGELNTELDGIKGQIDIFKGKNYRVMVITAVDITTFTNEFNAINEKYKKMNVVLLLTNFFKNVQNDLTIIPNDLNKTIKEFRKNLVKLENKYNEIKDDDGSTPGLDSDMVDIFTIYITKLKELIDFENEPTNADGILGSKYTEALASLETKTIGNTSNWLWDSYNDVKKEDSDFIIVDTKIKAYKKLLDNMKNALDDFSLMEDILNNTDIEFIVEYNAYLKEYNNAYVGIKETYDAIEFKIDNPQIKVKPTTPGSQTPRRNPLKEKAVFGGGTRRGGKRFHKKTIKKNLVHKKTFKKNLLYKNQFKRKQTHKK
jgi:hypothetical protein